MLKFLNFNKNHLLLFLLFLYFLFILFFLIFFFFFFSFLKVYLLYIIICIQFKIQIKQSIKKNQLILFIFIYLFIIILIILIFILILFLYKVINFLKFFKIINFSVTKKENGWFKNVHCMDVQCINVHVIILQNTVTNT